VGSYALQKAVALLKSLAMRTGNPNAEKTADASSVDDLSLAPVNAGVLTASNPYSEASL
jgi:hypothetical protein